ncbi:DUF3291 domain-containing protein [Microbulbifer sp. GL-2]|uniref:DUF3291 domain-containing protein n=1 Tax=Microbulbifer sp. GL-2 TaxID=2591606 RepID=UPI001163DFB5|nr:DUF3291 domain-containing protein [Microbulbifer sp. GL-2]BBM00122.1 hypothetical protein GL2_01960 [Microbulbifer sp. GL-2]
MKDFNLAQINIAQSKASMESETMRGFVERLDEINALADGSKGFVWRLQTEEGDATSIQAFDDPMIIVNMSVWEDLESLKNYVYKSAHVELIRDRDAWFNKMKSMHQALWWVPVGHIPTVKEGTGRLSILQSKGPSSEAFTFAKPFLNLSKLTDAV